MNAAARILVALAFGVASGYLTTLLYRLAPGGDYFQIWAAARVLQAGGNPYATIGPGLPYNWIWPLYYPAPAFLLALPLSWLPPGFAGATFFGISNFALAYSLLGVENYRLLLITSAAWIETALYCQWSPILTAAVLLPSLSWIFIAKPNLGLALFLARPTRTAVVGGLALFLLSLLALPTWPVDWLVAVRDAPHFRAPIASWLGLPLALAALKWRRWEARLLLALACVPQTPHFADTLPLFLIPGSWGEMLSLVGTSYVAVWWVHRLGIPPTYEQVVATTAPAITALFYLPCLLMVLRRSNEGESDGIGSVKRATIQLRARIGGSIAMRR